MVRQVKARRVDRRKSVQPRDLWLAGIGAVSLARKQFRRSYSDLTDQARVLRKQAGHVVVDSLGSADTVLNQARSRVLALVAQARGLAEARLTPVMARIGVKTGKPARVRKPAVKKAGAAKRARRGAA